MTIRVITTPANPANPDEDYVFREQAKRHRTVDKSDEYKFTDMAVEDGPADAKGKRQMTNVVMKYALDGNYIFAVYADNPAFHSRGRDEWESVAKNAIEKFAGMKGLQIKLGPRVEDHNRYNFMAEFSRPIENRPETLELFRARRELREEMEKFEEEEGRLKRLRERAGLV